MNPADRAGPINNFNNAHQVQDPNCMGRLVKWFRDDETSTVLKVGAAVLVAIGLVGILVTGALAGAFVGGSGTLAGKAIFALSAALLLALGIWAKYESKALDDASGAGFDPIRSARLETLAAAKKRFKEEAARSFGIIKEAVGGEEAFNQLPVLELDEWGYRNPRCIDWLAPEDLQAPVMRGTRFGKQPFIALKVTCTYQGERKRGVMTFLQRYNENDGEIEGEGSGEKWICAVKHRVGSSKERDVGDQEVAMLAGIIKGEDQNFQLMTEGNR